MTYTSIVVGTDGSETAELAVKHAGQLAKDHGARLVVVTAYEPHDDALVKQSEGVPDDIRWALTDRVQAEEKAVHGRKIAAELGLKGVVAQAIPAARRMCCSRRPTTSTPMRSSWDRRASRVRPASFSAAWPARCRITRPATS